MSGSERFQLLGVLGEGSYGVVYSALDLLKGTRVALKVLRRVGPDALLRFKREFRALVELRHRGLVELGELFEDEGTWFFSMELVEGVDVLEHVRSPESRPSGARLRAALAQLADALAVLHMRGKTHRDVKPSNTRVTLDGRVVLLDFGLVASIDDGASTAERVVGTIGYMAPEQAAGDPAGPAADCYAVGVMLFEALADRLPFEGTALEIMRAKQATPAPSIATFAADAAPDLIALCAELLERDPAKRPSAAQLAERLRTPLEYGELALPAAFSQAAGAPIGRERELAELSAAVREVRCGQPRQALVHGVAGVGKTALARGLIDIARSEPAPLLVLAGRCLEQESVPYKAFDAVIDALSHALARMPRERSAAILPRRFELLARAFPVLARVHSGELAQASREVPPAAPTQRDEAFAALRELFQRLCERQRVVLWVDDWHWADHDSVELLDQLVRAPDAPPMLILLTLRPLEECSRPIQASLERVCACSTAQSLRLEPLSGGASRALARQRLGERDRDTEDARVEEIARAAAGNPALIEWLAREAAPGVGAGALDDAILRSLRALPRDARNVLVLLSVAVMPLDLETLRASLDLPSAAIAAALDVLRREALVRAHPAVEATVEPFHPRAREVIRASLDVAERRALHAALARSLELTHGGELEIVALHWAAAGEPDRSARLLARAALAAGQVLAFSRAAALYERAVERPAPFSSSERHELAVQLARSLASAGQSDRAAEAFRSAAGSASGDAALELELLAARSVIAAGRVDHGLAWLSAAFAHAGIRWPSSTPLVLGSLALERVRLSIRGLGYVERAEHALPPERLREADALWSACCAVAGIDLLRCAELHSRCLRAVLELGEPRRVIRSLALESVNTAGIGSVRSIEARGRLAHAELLALKLEDPYSIAFTHLAWAMHHMMRGEMVESRARSRSSAAAWVEQSHGALWELAFARLMDVIASVYLGEFREARERYSVALLEAEARGNRAAVVDLITSMRWAVDLPDDAPDQLEASVDAAARTLSSNAPFQHTYLLATRLWIDLYRGGAAAQARIERSWPDVVRSQMLRTGRARIALTQQRGLAALAALEAQGRSGGALARTVEQCARQLEGEALQDALASSHALRGQLAMLQGDRARAIAHLRAATAADPDTATLPQRVADERLGRLLGGAEGLARIEATRSWAEREGIRDVPRFLATFMPVATLRP